MLDWVYFTKVYGSPQGLIRRALWDELRGVAQSITIHWLLAWDFNALLHNDEKHGGSCNGRGVCTFFNNF